MGGKLASILTDLRDPNKYVRVPSRDIFDEHDEVYWVNAKGQPVSKNTPGAKRKVRRFNRTELEKIAQCCNARDRTGTLSPLTLGHTDPHEPDERKQPEPIGYAAGYTVGYDSDRKKWMLRTDFYIRKDRYDEASTYPRPSIELWPDDKEPIVDPIALLRRTPARDLMWTYGRAGRLVLRYSMEHQPMPDMMPDDLPHDQTAEPSDDAKAEAYQRHCYSHPFAKHYHEHMARKYSADEQTEPPVPDPTMPPSADVEPPMQHSAFPSDTNGSLPEKEEGPERHARNGRNGRQSAPEQYRKDSDAVRFSRMERELADMRAKTATAEARRIVTQLDAEGYMLDAAVEVPAFAALDDTGREARAAHVRRFYRVAPVESYGRVSVAETPRRGDRELSPGEARDDAHQERALQYMRQRPGCPWADAVEKTAKA